MHTAFTIVQGTAIDPRKHYESHGGGVAATLHQEFWMRTKDHKELPIHLVGQSIPIRHGHELRLLYLNDTIVAVANSSTNSYINLVPGWTNTRLSWSDSLLLLLASIPMLLPLIDRWYFLSAIGSLLFAWLARDLIHTTMVRRRSTDLYHQVEAEIQTRLVAHRS